MNHRNLIKRYILFVLMVFGFSIKAYAYMKTEENSHKDLHDFKFWAEYYQKIVESNSLNT